jgi:RNA polymerase sigma-70 factor (ECF subfamily)
MLSPQVARLDYSILDEIELVRHARAGESAAFRVLMQRGNQRLYRIARSIVRDDGEAEDVLQESYVRAFTNLATFRGDASIYTWLTRIVLNEANGRLRKRRHVVEVGEIEAAPNRGAHVVIFSNVDAAVTPESDASRMQVRRMLESAIDELPADFRLVFMMRDVEGCTVAETAASLNLREETVKTRLHRARRALRRVLSERLASSVSDAFVFLSRRCDGVVDRVFVRLERGGGLANRLGD